MAELFRVCGHWRTWPDGWAGGQGRRGDTRFALLSSLVTGTQHAGLPPGVPFPCLLREGCGFDLRGWKGGTHPRSRSHAGHRQAFVPVGRGYTREAWMCTVCAPESEQTWHPWCHEYARRWARWGSRSPQVASGLLSGDPWLWLRQPQPSMHLRMCQTDIESVCPHISVPLARQPRPARVSTDIWQDLGCM